MKNLLIIVGLLFALSTTSLYAEDISFVLKTNVGILKGFAEADSSESCDLDINDKIVADSFVVTAGVYAYAVVMIFPMINGK